MAVLMRENEKVRRQIDQITKVTTEKPKSSVLKINARPQTAAGGKENSSLFSNTTSIVSDSTSQ